MATELPGIEVSANEASPANVVSASEVAPESPSTPSNVALTNIKLKTKASAMQKELSSILSNVKEIKDRCAMLQVENRTLQEYIESFKMEK